MRYRLAVFDFDGTIADTRTPISLSANRALAELGYEPRQRDVFYRLVDPAQEARAVEANARRDLAASAPAVVQRPWPVASSLPSGDISRARTSNGSNCSVVERISKRCPGLVESLDRHQTS